MMQTETKRDASFEEFKKTVLDDYKLALLSRCASLAGRREVLSGKAKFGVFGDGKEVAQIAMAKVFKNGDFRSGYYRDQTFMMAVGQLTVHQIFAALYADIHLEREPHSGGRQMNGHFATRSLHPDGSWRNLMQQKNASADISCVAGQMPRLLGLAEASSIYRNLKELGDRQKFSHDGNEIAFGTIGEGGTSEGFFWEVVNAAGVLQVPIVLSVWDDGYSISVPKAYQTVKASISDALQGLQKRADTNGWEILTVKGWDYPALIETYRKAEELARKQHVPVLVHVGELTQPQGHTTSGSHERYKPKERLKWESEYDCIAQMRAWILHFEINADDTTYQIAGEEALSAIESEAERAVNQARKEAWKAYITPLKRERDKVYVLLKALCEESSKSESISRAIDALQRDESPHKRDLLSTARQVLHRVAGEDLSAKKPLQQWVRDYTEAQDKIYGSLLYSESAQRYTNIPAVAAEYGDDVQEVDGRIVLRDNFDRLFAKHPELLTFGQDSGLLGDVNQGLEGLQKKYGRIRVSDAGIRESAIVGRGIGLAMRGLRPIAEIQYLDYILYAYATLSDDLATLHYRSCGGQKAPVIIRTRGHRLEGIWHSGSPMGALLNGFRGIYLLTPRNMTQAAGFYNTLLECDNPAIVVESLRNYRLKERLPSNLGEFKTPIGQVECLRSGRDITLVTYGFMCEIALHAARALAELDIDVEVIDARSLIPFDDARAVLDSLKKTGRLAIADEDVPGGCSAYLLQEILERQNGYRYLDSKPLTITAKEHRPAYGSDGDYFSKPAAEDVIEGIYGLMHEANPKKFPAPF